MIIYSIILLPIFSAPNKPKFCVDCKFFIKDNISNKYGLCSLFVVEKEENEYFLIDGIEEIKKIEYQYCIITRKYNDMCGKEGKFYEKNKH